MLSIVVCSISLERLSLLRQNIHETIGVEYEIIAIDNAERHWSIAKVYNYAAEQANYPYLFFVHEDVMFHSLDWGHFIEQKLAEPSCGVIGFAGSEARVRGYHGWVQGYDWCHTYYYQRFKDNRVEFSVCGVYWERPFEKVVVLDGFALFVRRDVWEQNRFDEEVLTGFHCYDIDFSLQIAKQYTNYVCCSFVLIEHFSVGSYNTKWYADTIRMHACKWDAFLPMMVEGCEISKDELEAKEERLSYHFLRDLLKTDCSNADKKQVLLGFWKRVHTWKHFTHCFTCTLKYIRYARKGAAL